jgi:hypothetical protein
MTIKKASARKRKPGALKKTVRLAVWVHYDSDDGYVWPQVYATEAEAYLDWKMNRPIKAVRLVSEPYTIYDACRVSGSFGTEIQSPAKAAGKRGKK